ncbi:MAG TPA: chemotaxis protein, partial [Massilia sp.]|nr:chemotaxis protein [Massilia sp.]
AKEIKELIGDSVSKVNAGSALVDQAGVTMGQIVDSVRKVQDIMVEIAMAGQRQSEGIEDIGRAIGSMDEMTQQNSALVEEASAAAESLTEQTGQLTGALSVFKLADAGAGPALAARPAPLALR